MKFFHTQIHIDRHRVVYRHRARSLENKQLRTRRQPPAYALRHINIRILREDHDTPDKKQSVFKAMHIRFKIPILKKVCFCTSDSALH